MPSPPVPTTLMNDLRRLGLLRTAEDLNDILARATRLRWSPTVLLEHIVTAELEERQRRSIERRLTAARLGRFKPIADWDWNWPTALDRPALERVLALDFLDRAENVILVGAQGLGKTMLAKNIVHQVVLAATAHASSPPRTCCSISTARRPPAPSSAASATTSGPRCSPSMKSDTLPMTPTPPTSSSRSSAVATNTVPCS